MIKKKKWFIHFWCKIYLKSNLKVFILLGPVIAFLKICPRKIILFTQRFLLKSIYCIKSATLHVLIPCRLSELSSRSAEKAAGSNSLALRAEAGGKETFSFQPVNSLHELCDPRNITFGLFHFRFRLKKKRRYSLFR